jgi:dihydroorotate dehydrogenase (fumarate)
MSPTVQPDISTTLAGIHLKSCIYNASGPRSDKSEFLYRIAKSEAGAVLTKSATLKKHRGSRLARTWHNQDHSASLNSEGFPNEGIDYYLAASTIEKSMGEAAGEKPYMVSLSGKSLDDNLEMLRRLATAPTCEKISSIELNLACPNIIGRPIIGYDFKQMDKVLKAVSKVLKAFSKVPGLPVLGIKLPPYFDSQHFESAATVLNKHKGIVKYVASINTVGNAFAIDAYADQAAIVANTGFGGLSGPAVKYTAIGNVYKLRKLLDLDIDVVGVGGIATGQDVYEMLLAGATAVQVGTCHWKEGSTCFDRMANELRDLMRKKGYRSLADCKGKLKPWTKEWAEISRQARKEEKMNAATTTKSSEAQFYKMLSVILAVLLAIVCNNKFVGVKLLPSE